jgi:hypothetical protein
MGGMFTSARTYLSVSSRLRAAPRTRHNVIVKIFEVTRDDERYNPFFYH